MVSTFYLAGKGEWRSQAGESKMMRFRYHRPVPNFMWTTRYFIEPCFTMKALTMMHCFGRAGANCRIQIYDDEMMRTRRDICW